jgi:hypothetical protein
VKKSIHKCTLANWKDLIRSKFALYILEKIGKDLDLPGAIEDAVLLQSSWKGARILNECALRSDENMKAIKDRFYGLWEKSKQGDIKAQEILHNLVLKIAEKQYESLPISKLIIRLALPTMFAEEKQKVLDHLIGKVAEWIGDDEGVRLFIEVVNLSDPKMKKTLIRAFKGHLGEIVEASNQTYVAVIKLLTEVDDTVQVEKSLLPEVEELIPLIAIKKHAFSIVFSLFSPRTHNFNVLGKYEHTVLFTECKKAEELRKKELRQHLYGPLAKYLEGQALYHLLKHHIHNKLIVGLYKSMQEDNQTELFNAFIGRVCRLFLEDAQDTLKLGSFEQSLCADPNANKIIKGILWLSDEVVDFYCDEFAKLMVKRIDSFVATKAGFVLLGLIEKGGRDYLLAEVKKQRGKLKGAPVGKHFMTLLGMPQN